MSIVLLKISEKKSNWGENLIMDKRPALETLHWFGDNFFLKFVVTAQKTSSEKEEKEQKTYMPCFVQQTLMQWQVNLNSPAWSPTAAKHIKTH